MRIGIIKYPGSNCDEDTFRYFSTDENGENNDVFFIWHKETNMPSAMDLLIIPGGFAFGDRYYTKGATGEYDMDPGKMAVKSAVTKIIMQTYREKIPILGICNGFQILTETGLLPGALKRNDNLHFISKHHHLKIVNNDNSFLQDLEVGEIVNIPVAHHDGNYFIEKEELKDLQDNGQVLLQYCNEQGENQVLNGSVDQIAGVCNKEKNVFGLMPHPERAMEILLGCDDGVKMLQGLLK